MPRMAITTNNSIKVNPFLTRRFLVIIISTVNRGLAHGAPNDKLSHDEERACSSAMDARCSVHFNWS
jgi:hypothetical protein